jgi:hypothetical protein
LLKQAEAVDGFTSPPEDEGWSAELVLAHITASDRSFSVLAAELLLGRGVAYDNSVAASRPHLEAIVKATGSRRALIAQLGGSSTELLELVGRVDDELAKKQFPTFTQDGERVLVDRLMSFSELSNGHAKVHLPAHVQQLGALRAAVA